MKFLQNILFEKADLFEFVAFEFAQNIMAFLLKNDYSLIKMVMLHRRRGVNGGQWRSRVQHEFVIFPTMIEIVTKSAHKKSHSFQRFESIRCPFEHHVHRIGHSKTVRPIVIGHAPVILADRQHKADEGVSLELVQSKQINKHVDSVVNFLQVVNAESAEPKLIQANNSWRDLLNRLSFRFFYFRRAAI